MSVHIPPNQWATDESSQLSALGLGDISPLPGLRVAGKITLVKEGSAAEGSAPFRGQGSQGNRLTLRLNNKVDLQSSWHRL